jgi:hypothetical protein
MSGDLAEKETQTLFPVFETLRFLSLQTIKKESKGALLCLRWGNVSRFQDKGLDSEASYLWKSVRTLGEAQ